MINTPSSPHHIARPEQQQIIREARLVREDGNSRVVLLYGKGGVGKTSLVRQLPSAGAADPTIVWLPPIDVDDSEYWLLANGELQIAQLLDPENEYFRPYLDYLSRLPAITRSHIGHEALLSHLGRIKTAFRECYTRYVQSTGKTVVITFDTVEAIRGMYLLETLIQWMKALPGTLFILSGRPLSGQDAGRDPIITELEDPHQPIQVTTVELDEFTEKAALDYVDMSPVGSALTAEEKSKLVRLTRGHPLWLAFAVSYLQHEAIPEELATPLADISLNIPYQGEMTRRGRALYEAFRARLMAPYRETDFWHESIKRLAVVRQGVNERIWRQLMVDRPLPEDAESFDEAWQRLLEDPWIRSRANSRFVTLHDAAAEELAQRIIPLHDPDGKWRRQLWQRVVDVYDAENAGTEAALAAELAALDDKLRLLDHTLLPADGGVPPTAENADRDQDHEKKQEHALIVEAARLDARKRELDQLKTARLCFQLLCDFRAGCRQFLDLFRQAEQDHDVLFQDLLALQMQRFLPSGVEPYLLTDAVGEVTREFSVWLSSEEPQLYLEIGLSLADYLIGREHPEAAIDLISDLPTGDADHDQLYRLSLLLGNAYMRVPGSVKRALRHFQAALRLAEDAEPPSVERQRLIAKAYKALGYYYRNAGFWQQADESYQRARDAILVALSVRGSNEDREEMASIQTNWAYIKGLGGYYREGSNLVESAITVRHRLDKHLEEGFSWSVCGEVYRYERRFQKAYDAYAEAERIFQEERNWTWLGIIYQEQAICLFQAMQDRVNLAGVADPAAESERRITWALRICRDRAVRSYPSALNRAGRIFGQRDFEAGLSYLAVGIDSARRLSDGWFWFANLIEYAELSYRAWVKTNDRRYREQIFANEGDIEQAMSEYDFPDLRGRWHLVRGHLALHDWQETHDGDLLAGALDSYAQGFAYIAQQGYVGSSGTSLLPGAFATFGELFRRLPADIRAEWQQHLRRSWSGLDWGSTLLLARLEELY